MKKNNILQHSQLKFVLIALSLCGLFFVYSFLAIGSQHKFASPDETANYFFSTSFARHLTFQVPQQFQNDIIAPRSIQALNGYLVPSSFLGLPLLYGVIGLVLGTGSIEFLTPFFSTVTVLVFYHLIFLLFKQKRIALLSAILLAIHPAFLYYTARGMFHNVLFVDFLIIAACLFAYAINRSDKWTYLLYAASGLFFGISLTSRLSEIVWVAPLFAFLLMINHKKIDWIKGFTLSLATFIFFCSIIGLQNFTLYDSPFVSGYTVVRTSTSDSSISTSNSDIATTIRLIISKLFLPFGVNPELFTQNAWRFLISLVWPYAIFVLLEITYLTRLSISLFRKIPQPGFKKIIHLFRAYPWLTYTCIAIAVSVYLVIYYGSWAIQDNPVDTGTFGFEQSYARYFLPIYILGIPFVARFLAKLNFLHAAAWILLTACVTFQSIFLSDINGLAKLKFNTLQYTEILNKAKAVVPAEAIILTNASDKIFFPEFSVVRVGVTPSPEMAHAIKNLIQSKKQMYLYVDEVNPNDHLLLRALHAYEIEADDQQRIFEAGSLYLLSY